MSIKAGKRKATEQPGAPKKSLRKNEERTPTNTNAGGASSQAAQTALSRRGLVITIVVALVLAVTAWLVLENFVWSRIPLELVGKWVVVGGKQDGATFDFFRSGAMTGRVKSASGMLNIIEASVRVDGDNIFSTTRHPQTGQYETTVLVIKTLNATELVVEDAQGKIMKMKRAE